MDAYQVPAKLSGLRPDHGPFNPDDGIYIQFDEDLKMTSVRVQRPKPSWNNPQAYDSGVFGHPTSEQIWGFESRILASHMAMCAALALRLQENVQGLNRPQWEQNIKEAQDLISKAQISAKNTCDAVGKSAGE